VKLHILLLAALALPGVAQAAATNVAQAAGESYLLIVTGLGGEPAYKERFHQQSIALLDAASSRYGLPDDHVIYLAEDPELDPERTTDRSTKDNVVKALETFSARVRPGDQLYMVFIGHGSFRSGESRLNLQGPDLTATELAMLLEPFSTQQVVFVNTASASGGFVKALSGKNRVVVTATKSGMERNETVFGGYFVEAYESGGADVNKDERVSVYEAFDYARRQVGRFYEENNRLMTEHAILDDNGDGAGTHDAEKSKNPADGSLAAGAFLMGADAAGEGLGAGVDDPELAALYEEMRALESRVEVLKQQKDAMSSDLYFEELEKLLVELAKKNRAISEVEGKTSKSEVRE